MCFHYVCVQERKKIEWEIYQEGSQDFRVVELGKIFFLAFLPLILYAHASTEFTHLQNAYYAALF